MDDQPTFEDPELADLVGDARVAYGAAAPAASPALASLFEGKAANPRSPTLRRTLAQLIAATTAVVAATGGLAVAGALPGSMQDAVSSAFDLSDGDTGEPGDPIVDETTTTTEPEGTTTTTSPDGPTTPEDGEGKDNHGAEVSAVAKDKTLHGCEHGQAVSEVASGKVKDKVCPHSTSTTTTTTVEPSDEGESEAPQGDAPGLDTSDPRHGDDKNGNGHGPKHDE